MGTQPRSRADGTARGAATSLRALSPRPGAGEGPMPEDGYQALVEQIPAVTYVEEVAGNETLPLFVSPQVEWVLGISRADWLADPDLWGRLLHPDDRDEANASYVQAFRNGEPWTAEYRMIRPDGRVVWMHDRAEIVPGPDGSPAIVRGVMLDITERKAVEETLRRRDGILEAVGYAASRFLRDRSWQDGIEEVLHRFGTVSGVSRVYVFQNLRSKSGDLLMDERFEWVAPGVPTTMEDPENHGWAYLPNYQRYVDILGGGGVICDRLSEVSGTDRKDMEDEDILSTVFLPIFAGNEWWGYLGFDDCAVEREWSPSEIDALRAAAGALGAAIGRERADRRRREAERKYQTLVEQIPAITYLDAVEDRDARLYPTVYISPQVEQILGYTPKEWCREADLWERLLHPDDRERIVQADLAGNRTGAPHKYEYRMIARDGRVVWVHDEALMIKSEDGRTDYWHGVMFDITALKEAEEMVARALEHEHANAEGLRALNEAKNTLLHAVSHDLRNPITAILGSATTLEHADRLDLSPDERDALMLGLSSNARKLNRLVTDLLDLDRLDRGMVEPRRQLVDLGDLVRRVAEEAGFLAEHPTTVEAGSVVLAIDRGQVERIVENLLMNAVRHTPAGTHVWVRVHPEPGGALLVVEDSGPGVPEDLRRSIFDAFRQGSPNQAQGVGIGLSLVAEFARLHGGRAWVEDRRGGGASFRVSLADAEPDPPANP